MKTEAQFDPTISDLIARAYLFAKNRHMNQIRKYTKEPYLTHPLAVAETVGQITKNYEMMAAALLHDIVEDTATRIEEIDELFGFRVARLVEELTNDQDKKKSLSKKIYLAQKLNSISSDALTIKLADRLHNVVELRRRETPRKFIKWYWKETEYILENLNRHLFEEQKVLINMLEAELNYLKFTHNFLPQGKEDGA